MKLVLRWLTRPLAIPVVQTGVTSLFIASLNGNVDVVRLLLDNMTDANLKLAVQRVSTASVIVTTDAAKTVKVPKLVKRIVQNSGQEPIVVMEEVMEYKQVIYPRFYAVQKVLRLLPRTLILVTAPRETQLLLGFWNSQTHLILHSQLRADKS